MSASPGLQGDPDSRLARHEDIRYEVISGVTETGLDVWQNKDHDHHHPCVQSPLATILYISRLPPPHGVDSTVELEAQLTSSFETPS